ncbi:hypothetical protein AN1V17_11580 [Vallitalea sediminicola]
MIWSDVMHIKFKDDEFLIINEIGEKIYIPYCDRSIVVCKGLGKQ